MRGCFTFVTALVVAIQVAKTDCRSIHEGLASSIILKRFIVELVSPGNIRREAAHAAVYATPRAHGLPV